VIAIELDIKLDDLRARNPIAISRRLHQAAARGGKLVGPCPICGGRASRSASRCSRRTRAGPARVCPDGGDVIRLVEKVEGCDFRAAIERLGGRTRDRRRPRQGTVRGARAQAPGARKDLGRLSRGRAQAAVPDVEERDADPRHRRRALSRGPRPGAARHCPGLRFCPRCHTGTARPSTSAAAIAAADLFGPGDVGAFIRPDGKFGGLHLTWLNVISSNMTQSGESRDPRSRFRRGPQLQEDARLQDRRLYRDRDARRAAAPGDRRGDRDRALGLDRDAPGRPPLDDMAFWAAGDLGNLAGRANKTINHPTLKRPNGQPQKVPDRFPDIEDAGLSIPDSVEELILLGDGDSEKVLTENAMERAARRYARQGRVIRIAFAPSG
jgi:hypothetical protein